MLPFPTDQIGASCARTGSARLEKKAIERHAERKLKILLLRKVSAVAAAQWL
jgi:hypothetical protein